MKEFGIFPLDRVKLLKGFFQKHNLFVLLDPVSVILVENDERFYDSDYICVHI